MAVVPKRQRQVGPFSPGRGISFNASALAAGSNAVAGALAQGGEALVSYGKQKEAANDNVTAAKAKGSAYEAMNIGLEKARLEEDPKLAQEVYETAKIDAQAYRPEKEKVGKRFDEWYAMYEAQSNVAFNAQEGVKAVKNAQVALDRDLNMAALTGTKADFLGAIAVAKEAGYLGPEHEKQLKEDWPVLKELFQMRALYLDPTKPGYNPELVQDRVAELRGKGGHSERIDAALSDIGSDAAAAHATAVRAQQKKYLRGSREAYKGVVAGTATVESIDAMLDRGELSVADHKSLVSLMTTVKDPPLDPVVYARNKQVVEDMVLGVIDKNVAISKLLKDAKLLPEQKRTELIDDIFTEGREYDYRLRSQTKGAMKAIIAPDIIEEKFDPAEVARRNIASANAVLELDEYMSRQAANGTPVTGQEMLRVGMEIAIRNFNSLDSQKPPLEETVISPRKPALQEASPPGLDAVWAEFNDDEKVTAVRALQAGTTASEIITYFERTTKAKSDE